MPALLGSRRLEAFVIVALVAADQTTKALVRAAVELHESVTIVPELVALTRVHNTGAAFGMLNGLDFPGKAAALTVVATLALSGVAWYATSLPVSDRLARAGIACILAGAIGNLIDRATMGYVLDYVDVSWRGWHFWAFNVADAAITIGVVLMICDLLERGRRASNPV
jgi:signal peptidase II